MTPEKIKQLVEHLDRITVPSTRAPDVVHASSVRQFWKRRAVFGSGFRRYAHCRRVGHLAP
jgi:hypothetical protein